jgi:multidrug resistance protein, MATE family
VSIAGHSSSPLVPSGVRREFRLMLKLAVPVVLSELGWMAMGIVDTIMVGRLGAEAIGVVSLGNALFYALAIFGVGLFLGLDTLVAQAYGSGDLADCQRSLRQGLYLAAILSPVLMGILWLLPPLLTLWGTNPAVREGVAPFLWALSWGTLPLLLYAAFRRYLQGIGLVRPVTFVLVSANLINLAGNWLLIYGKLGFPAMGVTGSGWSTAAARVYMAAVLAFFIWHSDRRKAVGLFHELPRFEWARFVQLIRLGFPAAAQISLEVGAFGAATILVAKLDAASLAAHQIALNCASVTYMVPLGISSAAAVMVGHAVGRRHFDVARRAGWIAIVLGVAFMTCAAIAFLTIPRTILRITTPDPRVIEVGVALLAMAALFQLFDGIQVVATGALRGLGNTRTAMIANLLGYWALGLPLGYVLCFVAGWGVVGLWLGLSIALIAIAISLLVAWSRNSRQLNA